MKLNILIPIILIIAAIIIVLGIVAYDQTISNSSNNSQPIIISTNKDQYSKLETVSIKVKNVGDDPVHLSNSLGSLVIINIDTNEVIWSPVAETREVTFSKGAEYAVKWQLYSNSGELEPGIYEVQVKYQITPNDDRVYSTHQFEITE